MRSTFKTVLVAMLAVFALSAVAASAAQAEEAPYFKVAGARLAEGQSKEVTAKAVEVNIQVGEGLGALRMECSLTLPSGAKLLGSSRGNPGRVETTSEIKNCIANREGCDSVGTTKSSLLLDQLVSSEKNKGKLEVALKANKGTLFMLLKLEEHCIYGTEISFSGSLVAEVYSGGKLVEIGKEPAEATRLNLVLPITIPTHYWLINEGKGEEVLHAGLESGLWGSESITGGSLPLELASAPNWGVFD